MDEPVFRCYEDKKFSTKNLLTIRQANAIIAEYAPAGLTLTLRQLYYQFVQRGLLPNIKTSYDNLGKLISDARRAGLVSWTAIEDRGRFLRGNEIQKSPKSAMQALADEYKNDLWEDQEWRPEVWIEKEALIGVIEQICSTLRVNYFACKGYNSQSEQWRAGRRFAGFIRKGQRPIVFHLGDHDPSGLDMTRDNRDRLTMFAGTPVIVERLALNYDQVMEQRLAPNPAKSTDSRFEGYRERFGDESWELDALDPSFLANLVRDAVAKVRDQKKFDAALEREVEGRRVIQSLAKDLQE